MMKKKIPLILVSLFFSFSSQADLQGPDALCGETDWPSPQVALYYCQPGPEANKRVEFCVYEMTGEKKGFRLAVSQERSGGIYYRRFAPEKLTHDTQRKFTLDNKHFGLFQGHQIRFRIKKTNMTASYRSMHYDWVIINDNYGKTDFRVNGLECISMND